MLKEASEKPPLKGILGYEEQLLVPLDYKDMVKPVKIARCYFYWN
ncbi:MAG: hypothetical protein NZ901_08120 [Geminocystis sp.]|nr:hypothetical protein [Geminocystis sp.]MCS7148138.1 hypothetical protein [Geminocystis sp.]MCX8078091.1 hypothetical protein [Geminocystis sp.]MDW8116489.1 hypothetical protein [Geminocystis sp.]